MNIPCSNNFDLLKDKNLLLISQDNDVIDNINENLSHELESLVYKEDLLKLSNYNDYNLIIIDISNYNLEEVSSILSLKAKDVPIIFIADEIDITILDCAKKIKLRNIVLKNQNIEFLKYYVAIILDKTNLVHFENGFSFDLNNNTFYKNNIKVSLTTLERTLLRYLIKRKNEIVTYEEIENSVWKNKKYSVDGMRNIIKQIREKSFYSVILNMSKKGYTIGNYHIFS